MGRKSSEILKKSMNVKFIDFSRSHDSILEDITLGIRKIISTNKFIDGFYVQKFEEAFASYCGVKYCVALNSGTSALHLAIQVLKNNNQPVVTAANSFFATAEAIKYNNLPIQFSDIDFETANLDIKKLEKLNGIGGLVPVSLYGNPCEIEKITEIAKNNKAFVVHDACQAHGAEHKGQPIAKFSDITCYSFYPSKNLGAFGEGGAIVTDNENLYLEIKNLKAHGQTERYVHHRIGYNYRMDEIQGFVLLEKLKKLEEWNEQRIYAAKRYNNNLKNNKTVKTLEVKKHDKCVYHLYPIFIKNRNELISYLNLYGIETGLHYPIPLHKQNALNMNCVLPSTELSCSQEISLPIFPGIRNHEIDYICEAINKYSKIT